MSTPRLFLRIVDPAELILSRINLANTARGLELRIHPLAGVDPVALDPLQRAGEQALADLVPIMIPGVVPIIRYHLIRNVPGGLVHVEPSPYQADVFLELGLMPQDVGDEIAGQSTNLMRHFAM